MRCVRQDRSQFDAAILASPVHDEAGELQQYFISVMELSEQVESRVRDHLQGSHIFNHAPGFIAFSTGPDHRFAFANQAYETLVGRRNLVGRRVMDAFPELSDQAFLGLLDRVYESGERKVGRRSPIWLARGPGGAMEKRYIDFIYEAVRDDAGNVIGLFCEGSDVTDAHIVARQLHETQAQLMHVTRINAMGTMAATLAHEINQPLAAIGNYASGCINVMAQSGIRSDKLHQGLEAIADASERAGKIISRLRELTRRTAPSSEIFDLSLALEETVQLVRAGGCDKVTITTQCTPSLLVRGDEVQVQQVMINLLRNACEAAASNERAGTVVAMSLQKDGRPSVSIRDNGPGLPPGMEHDLFQWITSSKADGMGIGLSISRTIAESHGGDIAVEQTGPSGTTLIFSLPSLDGEMSKPTQP